MSYEIENFLKKYSFSRINSATAIDLVNFINLLEQLSSTSADGNVRATIASLKKCPISQLAGRLAYLKSYLESQSKKKKYQYKSKRN